MLERVSKIGFERARLQPCRKKPKLAAALAAEGCFSPALSPFLKHALEGYDHAGEDGAATNEENGISRNVFPIRKPNRLVQKVVSLRGKGHAAFREMQKPGEIVVKMQVQQVISCGLGVGGLFVAGHRPLVDVEEAGCYSIC